MRSGLAISLAVAAALSTAAACSKFNVTAGPVALLEDAIVTAVPTDLGPGQSGGAWWAACGVVACKCSAPARTPFCTGWALVATNSCTGAVVRKVALAPLPAPPQDCASGAWMPTGLAPTVVANHTAIVGSLLCFGEPAAASLVFAADLEAQRFLWAAPAHLPNGSVWTEEYAGVTAIPQRGLVAVFAFVTGHTAVLDAATGHTLWTRNIKEDYRCGGNMPLERNVDALRPPLAWQGGAPTSHTKGDGLLLLGCRNARSGPDGQQHVSLAAIAVDSGSGNLQWRTDFTQAFPPSEGFYTAYITGHTDDGLVVVGVENSVAGGDGMVVVEQGTGDILASTRIPSGYSLFGTIPAAPGANPPSGLVSAWGEYAAGTCSAVLEGLATADLAQQWSAPPFNATMPSGASSSTCGAHVFGSVPPSVTGGGPAYLVWHIANAAPALLDVNLLRLIDASSHDIVATLDLSAVTVPSASLNGNTVVGSNAHGVVVVLGKSLAVWPWAAFKRQM